MLSTLIAEYKAQVLGVEGLELEATIALIELGGHPNAGPAHDVALVLADTLIGQGDQIDHPIGDGHALLVETVLRLDLLVETMEAILDDIRDEAGIQLIVSGHQSITNRTILQVMEGAICLGTGPDSQPLIDHVAEIDDEGLVGQERLTV